ncbi:MAG: hypothetical protein E7634_05680 [Ruminococcaceae bacterium]|nr:hypothetical protein [Oscillospiraceae bacterium]
MKKYQKLTVFLLCAVMIFVLALPISADMGPKPSVRVNFENLGDELCYGTLLSQKESTGPQSVWDGNEEHIYNYDLDIEIWRKFVEYKDSDGYHFLQIGWKVSDTKQLAWTYYPPYSFKILLYFPESDTFAVSGICERYAFDTYYTVDMDGFKIGSVELDKEQSTDERIDAYRSYQWQGEILSLIARILITIAIEMIVAILFGFRGKKQLVTLILTNSVTQIVLNLLLNVINYNSGQYAFTFWYVVFELTVFAIEAAIYCLLLKKYSEKPKKNSFYCAYAFIANAVSFAAGLWLAHVIPGIF